jgi:subtilisin
MKLLQDNKLIYFIGILYILLGFNLNLVAIHDQNRDYGNLKDIPRLEVEIPREPRIWETDIVVLRDSISAHSGKAMIGLKPPHQIKIRDQIIDNNKLAIREAISADQFKVAIEMLEDKGIEIIHIYRTFGAASVRMDPDIVYELFDHPMIDYIEIPLPFKPLQTIPWGIEMVNSPSTWSTSTGTGTKVMIIDTDISDHMDLPVIPLGNRSGLYHGIYDAEYIKHGTHVAGILMALDNEWGVVGVAPGINGNDVYSWAACDITSCTPDEVAAGIDAAINFGVDVINMSLGGGYHMGIANAVAAAWNADISMVAAAGNLWDYQDGGAVIYPAGHSEVIGVSGVKNDGTFANSSPCFMPNSEPIIYAKSNHGPHVEISAPFWAVSTTGYSWYYEEFCGTSMSTPHVTGTIALMKSINPALGPSEIRTYLHNSAIKTPGMDGQNYTEYYGYGLLDAYQSVIQVADDICHPIPFENQTVNQSATITYCNTLVRDVTVSDGAALTINSSNVLISKNFHVEIGAELIIQ